MTSDVGTGAIQVSHPHDAASSRSDVGATIADQPSSVDAPVPTDASFSAAQTMTRPPDPEKKPATSWSYALQPRHHTASRAVSARSERVSEEAADIAVP